MEKKNMQENVYKVVLEHLNERMKSIAMLRWHSHRKRS